MTTTAFTQDDLMAELTGSSGTLGRLAWFTVTDESVDQKQWLATIIQAGLAPYGLPEGIRPSTAYLRGLRAMQHQAGGSTLLRRVAREKGRTTHHWIAESVSGGRVHFQVLAAIQRDTKTDALHVDYLGDMTGDQSRALGDLSSLVETAARTYTPGDRRQQITRWIRSAGSLKMPHAGPVQFIPAEATGVLDALDRAQGGLGLTLWSMPLSRSSDVVETLTQGLDAEVSQKTLALLKAIRTTKETGKTPTAAQQAKLLDQLHDLDSRVQRYAGLFDTQLDNLTDQLALARQQVRQVLAE